VRELRKEAYHAAARALDEGADRVRADHLSDSAGVPIEPAETMRPYVRWGESLTREQIERALDENAGRVAHAAKQLGMARTQLYREMDRWGLKPPRKS
jgi:transcriptional regulator of acetoin/glycerol metabolism